MKSSERTVEEAFDAQQVLSMAQRLQVFEIEALGECTELREIGLRAARSGNKLSARENIAAARANISQLKLSDEATTIFETYQLAAEAYLDYVDRNYRTANNSVKQALVSANRMRREFGYAVELRRIHLGANLIKIAARSGAFSETIRVGHAMLQYILGDENAWPWPELAIDDTDPLGDEAKLFLIAQVLTPVREAAKHLQQSLSRT